MKWDDLLYAPFVGFMQWPLAALIPAAVLGAGSGECNIRVDLLLIAPLLWILTIVAIVKLIRRKPPHGAA